MRGTLLFSSALGTKTQGDTSWARERKLHVAANITISYLLDLLSQLTAALRFTSCLVERTGLSCG